MHLRQLELVQFRNYEHQVLTLAPGPVLLLGENAQGKTNLLEAASLLATGRSERSAGDADFIAWSARDEAQPFARIVGTVVRGEAGASPTGDVAQPPPAVFSGDQAASSPGADGPADPAQLPPGAQSSRAASGRARLNETTVELTIVGRAAARGGLVASKRYKLNGVPRRASDVIGAITAVLFTTDDMELVKGTPGGRRRYLDVMLSQVDRPYLRALQRYTKVITQRNALLRRIQEGASRADELAYWDEQLADDGALLLSGRARAVDELAEAAAESYARLSGRDGRERFGLTYEPRFIDGWPPERIAAAEPGDVASALLDRLEATRPRDIAAGVTVVGPHRDDLAMTLGSEAAATFASRGQQRTAALALRLAESRLLFGRTHERPLLLLDDVLSELDAGRRSHVLASLDAEQVLITSADPDRFDAAFVASAQVWRVAGGQATRG